VVKVSHFYIQCQSLHINSFYKGWLGDTYVISFNTFDVFTTSLSWLTSYSSSSLNMFSKVLLFLLSIDNTSWFVLIYIGECKLVRVAQIWQLYHSLVVPQKNETMYKGSYLRQHDVSSHIFVHPHWTIYWHPIFEIWHLIFPSPISIVDQCWCWKAWQIIMVVVFHPHKNHHTIYVHVSIVNICKISVEHTSM